MPAWHPSLVDVHPDRLGGRPRPQPDARRRGRRAGHLEAHVHRRPAATELPTRTEVSTVSAPLTTRRSVTAVVDEESWTVAR